MPIDTSMYSMLNKAPDIAGGIQDGMKMRDMIDTRNQNKEKFQMEKQNRTFDLISRVAPSIKDQESYTKALGFLGSQGVDLNGIPESYDPDLVNSYTQMAMSHKEKQELEMQNKRFDYQKNQDDQNFGLKKREVEAAERAAGIKAQKDAAELNATEAKQLGNYKIGSKAEAQYAAATSDPNEFNPTQAGQIIDNDKFGIVPNVLKNKKAVEAHAASQNWVETFLRDASGAAIPHNERQSYVELYFPQPGDTPEIVANKAELRKEKIQNALTGSGYNGQRLAQQGQVAQQQAQKSMNNLTNINPAQVKKGNQIDWK